MPIVALPAMMLTLGLSLLVVYVSIPHARRCITDDHPRCARKVADLTRARRLLSVWRATVAACWLASLAWDVLGITGLWPHLRMGAYLGLLAVMWFHLRWSAELQARLMQLERELEQPQEVIR
jgi:hypothetical protein